MQRQSIDREKISAKDLSDKELLSKIHKQVLKLNYKKTASLINGTIGLSKYLIKMICRWQKDEKIFDISFAYEL